MTTTLLGRARDIMVSVLSHSGAKGLGASTLDEMRGWVRDVNATAAPNPFTEEHVWLLEQMAHTTCAKRAGVVTELLEMATLMRQGRALDDTIIQKAAAYDRINTPEIDDFLSAVRNEALHQRERWPSAHDSGKANADWFWLVGYLAGKALHDVNDKRLHHVITAAAALLNWHAALTGSFNAMRPGIEEPRS
jgi:hypothetical protein